MKRRSFLKVSALASSVRTVRLGQTAASNSHRKKLAAITASYTMRSTADNLISRFLHGCWINDDYHQPACDIASLYVHQVNSTDVAHRIAAAYQIPVTGSISDALTLRTGALAVDGVLLVGEDYDSNARDPGQRDLRFDFFAEVVKIFKQFNRSLPVFCYGHLSTNWDQARQIYEWSRGLSFPLMAGSSPPVTFRRPELDYHLPDNYDDSRLGDRAHHSYPLGVDFDGALVISPGEAPSATHSSLEILQSFLERRKAGETGIRSLIHLAGDEVWRAAQEGRWSKDLMFAALGRSTNRAEERPEGVEDVAAWILDYNDGTQGMILSLGTLVSEYLAAFRIQGRQEIDSTLCYTPAGSCNDFSMLVQGVAKLMLTGKPAYPTERSLITSGIFSLICASAEQGGGRIQTPTLNIAYAAPERSYYAHGQGW
jgi:hypothetical protein